MLRISQCKTKINYTQKDLILCAAKKLKTSPDQIRQVTLIKRSLDARKKPDLHYSMVLDVEVEKEETLLKKCRNDRDILQKTVREYEFPYTYLVDKRKDPQNRPVIIGAGPAGLVCAYYLAKHGFRPILLERGKMVHERKKDVLHFWETGELNQESNVQFGEGGAGTFSDGKLNTLVKDKYGRCQAVLKLFHQMGAPESILYDYKPHVGTDLLEMMVQHLREEIKSFGGEIRFQSKVVDLQIEKDEVCHVVLEQGDFISTNHVVLAIGHSARDTFEMLSQKSINMEAKSFAIGLRVQHPQAKIDFSQYGYQDQETLEQLGAAVYKLTAKTESGRGVYSFCMCPGGYVVDASSEPSRLAINGMSYHDRASKTANSAIIISVSEEDFDSKDCLSGVRFQQKLEEIAYSLGNGKIPVQFLEDFRLGQKSDLESIQTCPYIQIKGRFEGADLNPLFTPEMKRAFLEGMDEFEHKIAGFAAKDTVLAGVESRTSSPVRIVRDESGMSNVAGLYPCGEGAGYAGGITSAAMDGIYIAECVAKRILRE